MRLNWSTRRNAKYELHVKSWPMINANVVNVRRERWKWTLVSCAKSYFPLVPCSVSCVLWQNEKFTYMYLWVNVDRAKENLSSIFHKYYLLPTDYDILAGYSFVQEPTNNSLYFQTFLSLSLSKSVNRDWFIPVVVLR